MQSLAISVASIFKEYKWKVEKISTKAWSQRVPYAKILFATASGHCTLYRQKRNQGRGIAILNLTINIFDCITI